MNKSPIKAFEDFINIMKEYSKPEFYELDPEKFDDLIKPFLLNPQKYSEHVHLISEARWAIVFMNMVYKIFPKFMRKRMIGKGKWEEKFFQKFEIAKENLLVDATPCELAVDYLPTRILNTPPEWETQNLRIHLLEIKIAVIPEKDLNPNSVDLKFEITNNDNIKIIDSFPLTDFSETGEYQIGLTDEGRFLSKSSKKAGLNLGGELGGKIGKADSASGELSNKISGGVSLGFETGNEREMKEGSSYQFKYTNKVLKVISSAVGKSATWKILRTPDNTPLGGHSFYLSLLIPNDIEKISYQSFLNSDIEHFGIVSMIDRGDIIASKKPKRTE